MRHTCIPDGTPARTAILALALVVMALSMVACAGRTPPAAPTASAATPTRPPAPTVTSAPPANTSAPPASPTSAPATATMEQPTATLPRATATMRPTAVPETTVVFATDEPTAIAEPDIAATLVAGFQGRIYAGYPSPDGSKRAEVLIYDCAEVVEGQENAYEILRIVDTVNGGDTRDIDSQLQYCGGLGAAGLEGLFWSPSGRFFYYTTARDGVPDGCGYWTRPYSRVDTTDWSAEYLGGGMLSLDGSRLATWDGPELVVRDIDGGQIGRAAAAVPNTAIGPGVWSPDGSWVAYLQAGAFCVPDLAGQTTVVLVDVPSMTTRVLLSSESPAFQDIAWGGPNLFILVDDSGRRWQLDMATGDVTERR